MSLHANYDASDLATIRCTISQNISNDHQGNALADGCVASSANNSHLMINTGNYPVITGDLVEIRAYLKAGAKVGARLTMSGARMASASSASWNLSTGALIANGAGIEKSRMTAVGDGWYLCQAWALAVASGTAFAEVYPVDSSNAAGFAGDDVTVSTNFYGLQIHLHSLSQYTIVRALNQDLSQDLNRALVA